MLWRKLSPFVSMLGNADNSLSITPVVFALSHAAVCTRRHCHQRQAYGLVRPGSGSPVVPHHMSTSIRTKGRPTGLLQTIATQRGYRGTKPHSLCYCLLSSRQDLHQRGPDGQCLGPNPERNVKLSRD